MRGDFLKSYVSSSYWLVSGKYAQSIMEALNSDVLSIEAKATEYKGGIRPAQSYDKIGNVAVISVNGAMDTAMSPIFKRTPMGIETPKKLIYAEEKPKNSNEPRWGLKLLYLEDLETKISDFKMWLQDKVDDGAENYDKDEAFKEALEQLNKTLGGEDARSLDN